MAVLALLGHPVSLADALVVESLAQALRNAGFMPPGALAVQEGAIIGAAARWSACRPPRRWRRRWSAARGRCASPCRTSWPGTDPR